MQLTWQTYAIVCPLIFLAGFIDSIAGGGGLISLPAYYLAGLPPYLASGTNKLSACMGTIASTWSYIHGKKVVWVTALTGAVMALGGSWLGTRVQLMIPETTVRVIMVCVIPLVAIAVLSRRDGLQRRTALPQRAVIPVSAAIGLLIGFYDGMVGPGTGTFLIVLFTMWLGMDAIRASGTAKLVNLASNIASVITWAISGNVLFLLGLPAALCSIAGNLLGSRMAMKKGAGFIRRILLVVLALLLAKMVWDTGLLQGLAG